jgi:hypothetical protein
MENAETKLQQARELLDYYRSGSGGVSSSLRDMFLSKSAIVGMIFQTLDLMTQKEWEEFAEIRS